MSKPDGAALKRVNSYQWPSGHAGQLTEPQQAVLQKFKDLCQQKGYFDPGDEKTPASHDDETLLRYLRARKFVPKDAFQQFKDTEDWRQANQLDTLYETIDIHEYEQTRRLYPQWTGRRDRRGIPFYVYEVVNVDPKDVSAYENDKDRKNSKDHKTGSNKTPRKMLRLFALYENLCRFVLPLCSAIPNRPNAETPVSQSSNIVDVSKVGIKRFWDLKTHLQDSSALATAYYPETLDHIFVVGAPSFFPTIWEWAKRWFDPITVQKITILSDKNMLSELSKWVHPDNIPKKYGGNLEWNFGDMPFLEPDIVDCLRWKEDIREKGHRTFPIGPVKWQYDDDGDLVATAIGTENGAPRNTVLAGLHPEAGVARLALSPGRQTSPRHMALFATVSGAGATILHQSTSKAPENEPDLKNTNGSAVPPAAAATSAPTSAATPTTAVTAPADAMTSPPPSKPKSDPLNDTGKGPEAHSPETSRAGKYTVPYHDTINEISHPPEDARQGTSSTRFQQQAATHAEGQLEDGTPHMREDGQGTKHTLMEPRTVGQAPKETPLTREEPPTVVEQTQRYAEQAKDLAVQGAATVASAVGLGGGKAEEITATAEETREEDPRVERMEPAQLEEFLREKSKSQPEKVTS